jgi:hypothetical protein
MAGRCGWKTTLDCSDIGRRLEEKKHVFDALIDDWAGNEGGPREKNPFWIDAIANISKSHGGLASTYTSFQNTQPG